MKSAGFLNLLLVLPTVAATVKYMYTYIRKFMLARLQFQCGISAVFVYKNFSILHILSAVSQQPPKQLNSKYNAAVRNLLTVSF